MRQSIFAAGTALLASVLATTPVLATTFDYTGAEQTFVVPSTGLYDIVAHGAQGGIGTVSPYIAGRGAEIGGELSLTSGKALTILVGGQGGLDDPSDIYSDLTGGGGGGSFVPERARALQSAINPVPVAVTMPRNGQTEGQINKLKTLKRAMYGRAGAELLRAHPLPLEIAE